MACPHGGSIHAHYDGIKENIEQIGSGKNSRAIIVGDIVDGMPHDDPRYIPGEQEVDGDRKVEKSILRCYNDMAKMFMPIRNKILCAFAGNHDYRSMKWGDCVKDIFCERLGIPYGTTAGKIIVNDEKTGKLQYKIFAYHPFTGSIGSTHSDPIMREATETSQMKRKLVQQGMGDCLLQVVAHFHNGKIAPPFQGLYLVDDGTNIKQKYHKEADPRAQYIPENLRWYASLPGYQKKHIMGKSGYVERAGYGPVELGCIRAFVVAGKITHMDKVLV